MVSFLSHQPFRQRDNLPDIPDTKIPPEFRFVGDDVRRELKLYFLVNLKSLPSLEVVIKEVPSNSLISMLLVSPSS